jgi:hypothetical protein
MMDLLRRDPSIAGGIRRLMDHSNYALKDLDELIGLARRRDGDKFNEAEYAEIREGVVGALAVFSTKLEPIARQALNVEMAQLCAHAEDLAHRARQIAHGF